ncbi:hypothetical protein FFLO_03979 [Filobasidium floriforme]|uniref:Uncharacterized protein n=1 Tax=Filobasidium floriforme TaxID=5210 RepID=A0A8K0JLS3_9TREE|nr:uncharacterized protein HD553DRAFT_317743 [Filobasidium floriforme]KAG7531972.1 hypothetical protein FFLO_03979 [Filobasidium floriforme]KAH8080235.1 hypothetical protein HD553DRAFT_317743 [Filobasidium floriforme]
MAPPPALSYSTHAYLTITLKPNTPLFDNPQTLGTPDSPSPSLVKSLPVPLVYVSQVGELVDSHIYQVDASKEVFKEVKEQVLESLRELKGEGVLKVDVMEEPKMRIKRGGEEL